MGIGSFLSDIGNRVSEWTSFVPTKVDYDPFSVNPLKAYQPERTDTGALKSNIGGTVVHAGLERVSNDLNWAYNNGLSQPLTTVALQSLRAFRHPALLGSAHAWTQAWHAANYISPGQAQMLGTKGGLTGIADMLMPGGQLVTQLTGTAPQQAEKAINSPLQYYQPASSMLPEGFDQLPVDQQQEKLKELGMPAVGNQYIQSLRRESTFFKYASGASDFELRWEADPTIMAGKAIGAAKFAKFVKVKPAGLGWTSNEIDKIMSHSAMTKTRQFLWANKDNPELLNNLQVAKDSAMGPRFGSIVSQLKTPDEVDDFIRVGMGDLDAIERLQGKNAMVAARLEQDSSRVTSLDLMARGFEAKATGRSLQYAALARQEIERLNARIAADEPMKLRYNQILDHSNEIDRVNLTKWGLNTALQRTEAQSAYRAGAALHGGALRERSIQPGLPPISRVGAVMPAPIATGLVKSHLYGVGDFFSMPVTLVRSFGNMRPNGYMRIDDIDKEAMTELRGYVARIPGITAEHRFGILNDYLKTQTEGERLKFLDDLGQLGAAKVAEKHGLDPELGQQVYMEHIRRKVGEVETAKAYSAARVALPGGKIVRVDEFSPDGSRLVLHPNLVTRLANDHVFQDLDEMDKAMARHASAFRALRESRFGNLDWVNDAADWTTHLFKAATLFRLGYIPRVAGDDLAGQWARNGSAAMAMRFGWGVRNGATNFARWNARAYNVARANASIEGIKYADAELAKLGTPDPNSLDAALVDHFNHYKDLATKRLEEATENQKMLRQGHQSMKIDGVDVPAAFGGKEGEFYLAQASADRDVEQLFARNKEMLHGQITRSFDHGGRIVRASEDAELHAASWARAINLQLAQDALARQAIEGASVPEMRRWMSRTAEGRAYRRRIGLRFVTPEDLAQRAKADVDQYLMGDPNIHAQALTEEGVTPEFLTKAVPNVIDRPEVHTGMIGIQGQLKYHRALDRVIQQWYNVAATIPANRMSRHPLFNQLYEGHMRTLMQQERLQGAARVRVMDVDRLATTARRLALRDTRKLVFDIAHRSDAAAAMKFISPFFAATAESFQRWGRIIADRPQIVGYANNFFNAPLAAGHMQDADGNSIMPDGTVIDPVTKQRKLVPKSERWIVGRMPKWLADGPVGIALGAERASGNFTLSQNSINIVTQGDPWFSPGVGPIVQIPVNELVKDKPTDAELARKLDILPFGPQQGTGVFGTGPLGRAAALMLPSTFKNALTALDTSDSRYQAIKLQIMQRAAFEHSELGKPMPSAQKIADMTRNYWFFTAMSSFTQPMSTQRRDAYQFYRDQYNNLVRQDPTTADDQFLAKYGESYFVFAQSQSKNLAGVPATNKAVALSKKYASLIQANPELAALIIGPEGNGPFSPEAYSYQLNTPLIPGGSEMQRTKMSATDAMNENQRRLGWAQYVADMNGLTAELSKRGLASFQDQGAEDLKLKKRVITYLYGNPLLPDGTANPYYNEQWSKDYYSLDPLKTERLVAGLQKIADSPLAADPRRVDLQGLQDYLLGRQAMIALLKQRQAAGGSVTLTAKSNADLAANWNRWVDSLTEKNTSFHDLYHRYLARDLGVDTEAT